MQCHNWSKNIVQWLDSAVSIVKMSDNALSICPMVGQCCVQQSNGCSMLCPTVRWLVSWESNSPMVGLCFVQLSNGRIVLCPTVRRSDNALSNCPMVGQCCVQQSTLAKCSKILRISSDSLGFKILLYWIVSNYLYIMSHDFIMEQRSEAIWEQIMSHNVTMEQCSM